MLLLINGVHHAHCVALCSGSLRVKLLKLLFCLIKMMIQTFVHFTNGNCQTQTDTSGQTEVPCYQTSGSRFKNQYLFRKLKLNVFYFMLNSQKTLKEKSDVLNTVVRTLVLTRVW